MIETKIKLNIICDRCEVSTEFDYDLTCQGSDLGFYFKYLKEDWETNSTIFYNGNKEEAYVLFRGDHYCPDCVKHLRREEDVKGILE